jgi:hypothetical protein
VTGFKIEKSKSFLSGRKIRIAVSVPKKSPALTIAAPIAI